MSFESLSKEEAYFQIIFKLEDQTTFGFNELRLSPYIQLNFSENPQLLHTLELFSFGTIQDYQKHKEQYIELSDRAVFKLSQLSIISKALVSNSYKYEELQTFLGIQNIQQFEQLIIESIYAGILDAKLYNQEQIIKINSSIGRDVLITGETKNPMYDNVLAIDDLIKGLKKFEKKIDKGINYIDEISTILKNDEEFDEKSIRITYETGSNVGSYAGSNIQSEPNSGSFIPPANGIDDGNSPTSNTRKRKIEIK